MVVVGFVATAPVAMGATVVVTLAGTGVGTVVVASVWVFEVTSLLWCK